MSGTPVFQTVSVMTTTGFAAGGLRRRSRSPRSPLLALMFVGRSKRFVKVVRHLVLFRFARHQLEQAVHPDAVLPCG
ncbi:hypothetical protein [Tsukamurella paurometabola]